MKKSWIFKALTAASIAFPLMMANHEAHAFTIKDDGEYALVMSINDFGNGANIDGLQSKVLKFNFDNEEESVNINDLTKNISAFNGKNEFSGWVSSSDSTEPIETLTKADFKSEVKLEDVSYSNGKAVYPLFAGKGISSSEKYQLLLKPFGGKVNGKDSILLVLNPDTFENIELSNYTAKREDCTFCGWGYDGKIVTSIDKSYFSKESNLTIFALYKSNTFYGVDKNGRLNNKNLPEDQRPFSYVLTLNANGGTIEGKTFKEYDYLNGSTSNESMPIFHYIPERKGCKFKGWNIKQDGKGRFCEFIDVSSWRYNDTEGFTKDNLIEERNIYTNLTLYAAWEGIPGESKYTTISSRKESEIEGTVTFEEGVDGNYTMDIKEVEVPENLASKNVKFMVDINLINSNAEIIEINGIKMIIKIKLPEILKDYSYFQAAYIGINGEIKETLPATLEDGYITFETTHLSKYGIIATNQPSQGGGNGGGGSGSNEEKNENENKNESENNGETEGEDETENTEADKTSEGNNPITGDGIACAVALFAAASIGMAAIPILNKKK